MPDEKSGPIGFAYGVSGNPYKAEASNDPHEAAKPVCAIACRDLLSYSRLASAARGAGYTPLQVEGPEAVRAVVPQAAFILVDLQDPAGGLAAVRAASQSPGGPVVFAIGPHVETDLLHAAREAGAAQVLTHGSATEKLATLLTKPPKEGILGDR